MIQEFDLFSYSTPRFHIGDKKIRLIEMFGGVGCQAKGLKNLGVEFEHYRYYEIDQNPVNSYNAIFDTNFTPKDITQVHGKDLEIVNTDNYCYITTYSFPCQDLSNAGKQRGMEKGSGTRSGLLWEVERILDECKDLADQDPRYGMPTVLIMENVPAVIGQKNIKAFQQWRRKLESLGYSNHVKLLNAKEIGYPEPVPQNRNRCFMVSIYGDYYYEFPTKKKLTKRLKDILEPKVDEKYYLSERALNGIVKRTFHQGELKSRIARDGVQPTLCARDYKDPGLTCEIMMPHGEFKGAVRDVEYSCTIKANVGQWHPLIGEESIMINNATKKGYTEAHPGDGIDLSTRPKNHRGTVQKGISQTIKTTCDVGVVDGTEKGTVQ